MIMLSTNQLPMHASLVSVRPGCGSSRRPRGVSSGSIASPLPSELPAPGVRCILQAVTGASLDDTLHDASVVAGGGAPVTLVLHEAAAGVAATKKFGVEPRNSPRF